VYISGIAIMHQNILDK